LNSGRLARILVGHPTIISGTGQLETVFLEKPALGIKKLSGKILKKVWMENTQTLSLHSQN
jgi:hypothetical protein